jgi:hypothetical protein
MLLVDFLLQIGSGRIGPRRASRRAFLLALALSAAVSATAQEIPLLPVDEAALEEEEIRRYTVEIIVFTYNDSASVGTEMFTPEPVEETPELIEFGSVPYYGDQPAPSSEPEFEEIEIAEQGRLPDDGDLIFADEELVAVGSVDHIYLKELTPEQLTLTDVHAKLVALDAYRPVLWGGWTQAILEEEETPFIVLRRLGNLPLNFEGNLKLYVSRFLHLIVDVGMQEQVASPDDVIFSSPEVRPDSRFDRDYEEDYRNDVGDRVYRSLPVPVVHYRIIDDRIMKSGDIRYFDHPKFGVLVKVVRYEEPEEEEEVQRSSGTLLSDTEQNRGEAIVRRPTL